MTKKEAIERLKDLVKRYKKLQEGNEGDYDYEYHQGKITAYSSAIHLINQIED